VNHLKSKGSDCNAVDDPDTGDGQGNCNLTRLAAAQALVDWLATDPTGSGDADALIIGDLNSYDKEDPIDAILAGADDTLATFDDYTDLVYQYQGEFAYSYLFDGQLGYLDHALASPTMAAQVTGATVWHINADEPDILDYDMSFKQDPQDALFEPNAFRSSDHDPVIVGLDLLHYDWTGFFQPIDNEALNEVKAGSSACQVQPERQPGARSLLHGLPAVRPHRLFQSRGNRAVCGDQLDREKQPEIRSSHG
jgi:predicted extracellular nuclease